MAGTNGNLEESFFLAPDILPTCPITPEDYRRVLIDFPGVRNAWLERVCPDDVLLYLKKQLVERDLEPIRSQFWNWFLMKVSEGITSLEMAIERIEEIKVKEDPSEITSDDIEFIKDLLNISFSCREPIGTACIKDTTYRTKYLIQ